MAKVQMISISKMQNLLETVQSYPVLSNTHLQAKVANPYGWTVEVKFSRAVGRSPRLPVRGGPFHIGGMFFWGKSLDDGEKKCLLSSYNGGKIVYYLL